MSAAAPTMIIPNGTQITVDDHGQLSVRTPGNLVIQNSGSYGTIESATGSIRIESDVQLEAVNIRCAETCYIQGDVTAWKVQAKAIELEESARAHIIMQESERLHIGSDARLVGNFSSEKELFLLFSRFARQLRQVPFFRGLRDDDLEIRGRGAEPPRPALPANGDVDGEIPSDGGDLEDALFFAQVLLEREASRPGVGPVSREALEQLVELLRSGNVDQLRARHGELFDRIADPSDDVRRAADLIGSRFES